MSTRREFPIDTHAPAFRYALAVLLSAIAIAATVFTPLLEYRPYFPAAAAITVTAWFCGFRPALLSIVLTLVSVNLVLVRSQALGWRQVAGGLLFAVVSVLIAWAVRAAIDSQREAARQSQRLQAMFRQAAVGIAHVALDGRLVRANQRMAAIVGRPHTALPGMTCDALVHPADAPGLHAALAAIAAGERAELAEDLRCRRPDGSVVWVHLAVAPLVDADGRPESLIAVIKDIHERRMAEERARLHEERARLALDIARLGTWNWAVGAREAQADDRTREICGFPAAGAIPVDLVKARIHPEDWPRVRDAGQRAFATGRLFAEEFRFVHEDRVVRWVVGRGQVVPAGEAALAAGVDWPLTHDGPRHDGLARVMLGSVLDVTARRTAEEALRLADRQKDDFLALLSHELRNPLAPIRTAIHLLKLRHPPDPDTQRLHGVIERQVQHLVRLVDDLLDVSRVLRGKIELRPETLDVATVVGMAIETTRPVLDARRQHVALELPAEPVYVHGDQVRLSQVIGNLLHNAGKFSERGSTVGLEVTTAGGDAIIRVRDTGVGIAPEILPTIFEPFVQADRSLERSEGGLGIGLTLVRKIIELHGGTVTARSEGVGRGTELVIHLAAVAPPEHLASAEPLPVPVLRAGLQVLVVDDNVDAADSLAALLRERGLAVRVAHNGQDALAEAMRHHPDVVLLDIGLPGMNGYEVAAALRRQPGGGPALVAITGYGQDADARRAEAAGFDRHLVKPVDAAELEQVLAAVTR